MSNYSVSIHTRQPHLWPDPNEVHDLGRGGWVRLTWHCAKADDAYNIMSAIKTSDNKDVITEPTITDNKITHRQRKRLKRKMGGRR